jgi:WD40 repeat protein/energy-coupling factor transporter ATP-binding protein EcfA2
MQDETRDSELSLDDIFSRKKREGDSGRKKIAVPFKFLDSYTKEDKNIFFGRDSETEDIFRKFYSGKLLLVYGKSGTGKSSIINCGLISRIPQEDIYPVNIRCGNRAYENFISEIKKYSKANLVNPLDILEDIFYEQSKPVALIFDQFEEIFILSDEEEREKLARDLNEILKSRLKINIILIIREEYFANLTEFEAFIPGLYGNRLRIERMSKSSAKDAIIKPCLTCNVGIEDGLADQVIGQLVWQSEGLELTWLQILMDKLYRTATERDPENPVIKQEDLTRFGRIGNVLSDFLDEQLRTMPHGDIGEAILKTMVSADGTKKQVNLNDISDTLVATGHSLDQRFVEEILGNLIDVRLITDKNELGYYEFRHDAIAGRIYERMTAIEKELIEVKSFLENSYKIYQQREVLLTENDLKYISLHENKLILNEELKDFIRTCKKEVQRARQRRRNIAVVAAVSLIVILSVFTLWAFIERTNALEQKKFAEGQKNEALKANVETEKARAQALEGKNKAEENESIAVEQKKLAEGQRQAALLANREAENSRIQALSEKNKAEENEKLALSAKQQAETAKNEVIKAGNQARFYLYLFNGKELANKSLIMQENDTLRGLLSLTAYDLATYGYENFNKGESLVKYDNEILSALQKAFLLFEPDSLANGEIWAIGSKNNRIIYSKKPGQLLVSKLETKSKEKLPSLQTVTEISLPVQSMVRSLSFDSTSKRVACGTIDGNVILIHLDSSPLEQQIIYSHNNNRVLCLTFVPGKDWLISSSTDRTIHIWDVNQQKTIKILAVKDPVQKFVLIDSDHLVFTNSTGNILEWDLNDIEQEPKILYSNESHQSFNSLTYNAAHKWLAASSLGNLMIFPFNHEKTGSLKPELFTVKHKAVISQIDFSPDNNWLVSASQDAIMLWDIRDVEIKEIDKIIPVVIDNSRQIFSLTFDDESKYIMYGDNRSLHIYPIDIQSIYRKFKLIMGKRELTDQEWKFYVKGDLEKPRKK